MSRVLIEKVCVWSLTCLKAWYGAFDDDMVYWQMESNCGPEDTSSDEDEPHGATLMPGAVDELEGSATKYLQDQVEESTADSNESVSKKDPKYVEVDPLKLSIDEQPKSKPQPQPVEYARLKPVLKAKRAPAIVVRSEPTRTVRGEAIPKYAYIIHLYVHVDPIYSILG